MKDSLNIKRYVYECNVDFDLTNYFLDLFLNELKVEGVDYIHLYAYVDAIDHRLKDQEHGILISLDRNRVIDIHNEEDIDNFISALCGDHFYFDNYYNNLFVKNIHC